MALQVRLRGTGQSAPAYRLEETTLALELSDLLLKGLERGEYGCVRHSAESATTRRASEWLQHKKSERQGDSMVSTFAVVAAPTFRHVR